MGRRNRKKKIFTQPAVATAPTVLEKKVEPIKPSAPLVQQPSNFIPRSQWFTSGCPVLQLSPLAFLKWQFLCNCANVEVGAFGISKSAENQAGLLYIEDMVVLDQECTSISTEFDEDAVLKYYDALDENDIDLRRGVRVWFHTHPEMSANPSSTDEDTFVKCFGNRDWAVMAILSKTNDMYARITLTAGGIRLNQEMDIIVDWPKIGDALEKVIKSLEKWKTALSERVKKPNPMAEFTQSFYDMHRHLYQVQQPQIFPNLANLIKPQPGDTQPLTPVAPESLAIANDEELKIEILTHESMKNDFADYAEHCGWLEYEEGIFYPDYIEPTNLVSIEHEWKKLCDSFERAYEYKLSEQMRLKRVWSAGEFSDCPMAEFVDEEVPF